MRFASVAAASGTRSRSAVIARGPLSVARVAWPPAGAVTVAVVVPAPAWAGLGSRRPAWRRLSMTSVAGSAGLKRVTPFASANVR